MISRVTDDILDAAEHLPGGAILVVPEVGWDDYEHLLEELAERPHFRVSYDCGRLEIMSPLPDHEGYARFFDDLVRAYADFRDIELCKGCALDIPALRIRLRSPCVLSCES
jgi:Uma2 family endonuclease